MYLPDLPQAADQDLLDSLDREFTYAFGGCTIIREWEFVRLAAAGDGVGIIRADPDARAATKDGERSCVLLSLTRQIISSTEQR